METQNKAVDFIGVINQSLKVFFTDFVKVSVKNPLQAIFFSKTVLWQQQAAKHRKYWEEQGVHVPPIAIFSITNQCNLKCKGCYHWELHKNSAPEMNTDKMRSVIQEAKDLGISFMVLAGGEPFVRQDILDITQYFPEIIFLIFTNGLMINAELLAKIKKQKNIVPVISLEGFREDTDMRRGKGVYDRLRTTIDDLKKNNIFYSVSITISKQTFDDVFDEEFIKGLVDLGCKLFFFVEYTPIKEGTEDWMITKEQRDKIMETVKMLRKKYKALFIAVPGDEEEIGGCMSAGKGFVHISADGNVEPCPFAPYSDTNLREMSLKDALQSRFLKSIRDSHEHLSETEGGCALWVKRQWVRSMLKQETAESKGENCD
jgi:MoaA/NifB/PqqE/SkfB family radical SAM enzyme